MDFFVYTALVFCAISAVVAQQYNGYQQQQRQYEPQQDFRSPLPAILTHKQALTHDGGFNYAFAADNGLKQGESIAPDGTRTGAYQYVDPNGKTISVKYTAGKEGFRILEGDHVPKAPPHVAPQPGYAPQPQYQSPPAQQQYSPYRPSASQDDGQYREEQYSPAPSAGYRQSPATYSGKLYHAGPQTFNPNTQGSYSAPRPSQAREDDDFSVEPGKPHTFGTGYSFEFAG